MKTKRLTLWHKITLVVCAIVLFIVGIFALVLHMFKPLVAVTLETLEQNEAIAEQLGTPLAKKGLVLGNMQSSGYTGYAVLSFDIVGPQGTAKTQVYLEKSVEGWSVIEAEVLTEDQTLIKLP